MKTNRFATLAALSVLALAAAASAQPADTHWEFDGTLDPASGLGTIEFYDGPGGLVEQNTEFGTTTSFGIPDINGVPASVMHFIRPCCSGTGDVGGNGYKVFSGAQGNGGGAYINEYSVVMDILIPASSFETDSYLSFINTNESNVNDGDLFCRLSDGGVGISGQYNGQIVADTWARVAWTWTANSDGSFDLSKFINGELVGVQRGLGGLDGRFSLYTVFDSTPWFLLFADDDGDQSSGFISSLYFTDVGLLGCQIADMGGPNAAGIPAPGDALPAPAAFGLISPADGATDTLLTFDFSWEPSENATGYSVLVAAEPTFTPPLVFTATTADTSVTIPTGVLNPAQNYYWSVVAMNRCVATVSTPVAAQFRTFRPCPADFNGDGFINSDDIADFVNAYFSACN